MILEREIGTVHVDDLEVGHGLRSRILCAVFVRSEAMGAGMGARIVACDARDDRILEDQNRIAL